MTEVYISADEIKQTDVICRRGIAGNSHPGFVKFRSVIAANKKAYDQKPSCDRDAFARQIFAETFKSEGVRFVRAVSEDTYVVLDDDKCARKIWAALRDHRGSTSNTAATVVTGPRPSKPKKANVLQEQQNKKKPKTKKQKQHWMTVAAAASPVQTKDFDASAFAAIKSLLANEALDAALKKNWGGLYDKKRARFEEQILTRYRAAARQKGMSVEDFSKQLLPVLLREASGVDAVVTETTKLKSII